MAADQRSYRRDRTRARRVNQLIHGDVANAVAFIA